MRGRLDEEREMRRTLERELEKLRLELQNRDRRSGDAAVQLERAHEQRMEHLQRVAMRRLGQQELAKGWSAWTETYLEGLRKRNLLKQAGARLTRPRLIACVAHWRDNWEVAQKRAFAQSMEGRLQEEMRLRQAAEAELQKLRRALSDTSGTDEALREQR
eukprot:190744-Prymnesium_polylepis.1